QASGQALFIVEQDLQQMLRGELLVTLAQGEALGGLDEAFGPVRILIEVHKSLLSAPARPHRHEPSAVPSGMIRRRQRAPMGTLQPVSSRYRVAAAWRKGAGRPSAQHILQEINLHQVKKSAARATRRWIPVSSAHDLATPAGM